MHFNAGVSVLLHLLLFAPPSFAGHAQFFDKASNVGFALSTVRNETSTDLLFQISAPQNAGWGSVGTGDRMDGSVMFIIYPSGQGNGVTVSVRTSSGHDTPSPVAGIDYVVQSSMIQNSVMSANLICRNCTTWSRGISIDLTAKKQPWIFAAGPGQSIASTAQDAEVQKHSAYGTFFMDMTATRTISTSIPTLSGRANLNTTALPGSVGALVILHAICLGGSFVILFPLGVCLLRFFSSFRLHWILQTIATMICAVGLAVAVALSVLDVEYDSFTAVHQIIGIVVVAVLVLQMVLGYIHHKNFRKVGGRTFVSYAHLWTGRTVIVVGMVNTVLGFLLSRSTAGAIGVAILAIVIVGPTFASTYIGERRRRAKAVGSSSLQSSTTALVNFGHPYVREDGRGEERGVDT